MHPFTIGEVARQDLPNADHLVRPPCQIPKMENQSLQSQPAGDPALKVQTQPSIGLYSAQVPDCRASQASKPPLGISALQSADWQCALAEQTQPPSPVGQEQKPKPFRGRRPRPRDPGLPPEEQHQLGDERDLSSGTELGVLTDLQASEGVADGQPGADRLEVPAGLGL